MTVDRAGSEPGLPRAHRHPMKRRALPALAAMAALALAGPAGAAVRLVSQAATGGTQSLVLHSDALGREVTVDVTPPEAALAPGVKAAAIYVLDRGMSITGLSARILQQSGAMAPAFVVAIANNDPGADRNRDFVHARLGQGQDTWGGGGAAYEAFLVDELKPFIEARYAADPARSVLFGHSLGGLFAATVLVRHPRAFSAYLIASPSIWATPALIEEVRRMPPASRPARVFIGYGDGEEPDTIGPMHQFAEALAAPRTGLDVREQAFEGQNHQSSFLLEGPMGLPFLLPP
jgi:predicted alpha/beta superfamily hydrolase